MRIASLLVVALVVAAPQAAAQPAHEGHGYSMIQPGELKWSDAPSVGPGVKIAVIEGPLNQAVPFTFRLRMPANTRVPPHVHPAYERVTVLSGTFHFAHGDSFDAAKTLALGSGSVAIMPPGAPMFGFTREETVIQLHGTGPWGIRYLNPAEDPRRN